MLFDQMAECGLHCPKHAKPRNTPLQLRGSVMLTFTLLVRRAQRVGPPCCRVPRDVSLGLKKKMRRSPRQALSSKRVALASSLTMLSVSPAEHNSMKR